MADSAHPLEALSVAVSLGDADAYSAQPECEPFVGRVAVLARLQHAFRGAQGRGASVLVQGEPGVGKTRLLQRFADTVRASGGQLLFGHGRSEPGAPALWPWIEVLQSLLRVQPHTRDIRPLLQAFEPWLARDPQARAPLGTTSPLEPASQFMLLDTLVRLVLDAAESGPLCLVLEDLHEFDPASLQVLSRLLQQLYGSSVLVLASSRTGEELAQDAPFLTDALAGFAQRFAVMGLDASDVRELMAIGLGHPVTAELASTVHQRAEGNPLYVNAVIAMLQSGEMQLDLELESSRFGLPVSLWLAGQRQLDCLPHACRRVLRAAAVFGREFELDTLVRCASLRSSTADLEVQLLEACRHRVLRRLPVREPRYRFTHVLLREVLEQELDPSERARAHGEAARALLPADGQFDPRVWCGIARHWLECDGVEALELSGAYADRAAASAKARGAHAEAAAAFDIVVAAQRRRIALAARASPAPTLQIALGRQLLAFGAALWRAGQLRQALASYFEAVRLAQVLGDQPLLADAALATLDDCCMMMSHEQLEVYERACQVSEGYPLETRIRLLAGVGAELCFGWRRARGAELVEEATLLAADCAEPIVQLAVLRARHLALDEPAPLEERRALLERRAAIAARCRDDRDYAWAHSQLLRCAIESADPRSVRAHYEISSQTAARAGEPLIWFARMQACTLSLLRGQFEDAGKLAHEARQLGSQIPNSESEVVLGQHSCMQNANDLNQSLHQELLQLGCNVWEHYTPSATPAGCVRAELVKPLQ